MEEMEESVDSGILFVDDEESILSSLRRELRPWFLARGLIFWPVPSGEAAVDFLARHHRKVLAVVTDMRMPGMSGEALVEQINRSWPEIHTLLLSGHAELQGLSRAVGAGIRGFLTKPWEPEALIQALDRVVQQREKARRTHLQRAHLTHQLTRTRDIQTTLFHHQVPDPERFGLELTYRPMAEQICGGDFYEVFCIDEDRCVLLVGDVSGHGAEAAFLTGILHTLLSRDDIASLITDDPQPGMVLEALNEQVFRFLSVDQPRNVVLTALLFDRAEGLVTYSNAGGLPLVRIREGQGSAFHLQGLPLGLSSSVDYPVRTLRLEPGDRWLVMTDGLVDRGRDGFLPGGDLVNIAVEAYRSGRGHQGIIEDSLGLFPSGEFLDDLTLVTVEVR